MFHFQVHRGVVRRVTKKNKQTNKQKGLVRREFSENELNVVLPENTSLIVQYFQITFHRLM